MATSNVLLTLKVNSGNAQKSVDAFTRKVNSLTAALNKASQAAAKQQSAVASATSPQRGVGGLGGIGQSLATSMASGKKVFDSAISGIEKRVQSVSKMFTSWQRSIQSVGDSMRLLSQSISTVGRVMTFVISAPLGLFLKNQAGMAIDFEDALTRVRKVTGFTTEELARFKDGIRDLATTTSTSHTDLLSISEVIGQMGVTSTDAIVDLTRIFNMFSISTGVAADTAATNLGRISNAFGWNLNASSIEVERLANVLNKLENTNAATAGQIMKGVSSWAQQANLLGINAEHAAALTTTLIAMGMSESEAGTAMRRASSGMIEHRDAVVSSMSAIEGYGDAQSVLTKINENALGVMLDIIDAASNGSDQALALAEMLEIGGARGGRALAALSGNTDLLRRNLSIANREWANASSLMEEYELAMTSTKNQMGLLKNNINDVGITIGDAMLPTINQLIMILVPALQMFNQWFKTLSDGKKQMIVFGAIALVALGPALFIFGQLTNAVSLVILGFGRLIMLVPQAFGVIAGLIKPILMVSRAFISWPVVVVGAIFAILKILSGLGVNIAGFFINLGNSAVAWGERLAQTYAGGFIAGAARYIAAALQWVANLIASFFKGSSPPKAGPLSTIDKWGSKVMEAYLEGFKKADFAILSEVGRTIETVLTRGLESEKLAGALEKVAGAKFTLSKLISKFNETGVVDEKMLGKATKGLGVLRDNVKELIKNWLEYNKIQERIAQIEERRKQVKRSYMEEIKAIASSTMSIKDKVEAIRAAQRARDDDLQGLDEEQEVLEEQAEEYKDQIDYQKLLIAAMTDQDDLLQKIIDSLKKVAEAVSDVKVDIPSVGGFGELGGMSLPDVDNLFEKALSDFTSLKTRLEDGKKSLQGFLDAWNGYNPRDPEDTGFDPMYDTMYRLGAKAREIYDTLSNWYNKAVEIGGVIKDFFTNLELPDFSGVGDKIDFSKIGETIANIKEMLQPLADLLKGKLADATSAFATAWDRVKESFARLKVAAAPILPVLAAIGAFIIGVIGGVLFGIVNGFLSMLDKVILGIGNWISGVVGIVSGLITFITNIVKAFQAGWEGDWDAVVGYLVAAFEGAVEFLGGIFLMIWGLIQSSLLAILDFVGGFVNGVIAWFQDLWFQLIGGSIIPDMLSQIGTAFVTFISEALANFAAWVLDTIAKAVELKDDVVAAIGNMFTLITETLVDLGAKFSEKFEEFRSNAEEKAGELKDDVVAGIMKIGALLEEKKQQFINWGKGLIDNIIEGVESAGTALSGALRKVVDAAIASIKKFLGISDDTAVSDMFGMGFSSGVFKAQGALMHSLQMPQGLAFSSGAIAGAGVSDFNTVATNMNVTLDLRESRISDEKDIDLLVEKVMNKLAELTKSKITYGGRVKF